MIIDRKINNTPFSSFMSLAKIVIDERYLEHLTGQNHPERPSRILAIKHALDQSNLLNSHSYLAPRLATEEEILLCHDQKYYQLVKSETQALQLKDGSQSLSTGDVCISPHSFEVAHLAVGGVLAAADEIMHNNFSRAFVVARPPGHHACRAKGMGFCLFNQAAIGARYLQKKYGIKNVLIVDWDVHHGNGTEEIFYEDPSVFYFSTHQAGIYPGTGFASDKGTGPGEGFNLNCPIHPGLNPFEQILSGFAILKKEMEKFKPDFVIISCGFDAHEKDPLGGLNLKDEHFTALTNLVIHLANTYSQSRIISILEGGYSLEALASASIAHFKPLNAPEGCKPS